MPDGPFWQGGSIPTESELRNYLSRSSRLSPEEIARVVADYRNTILNDPDLTRDWPQMAVNSWVNQQVSDVVTDPNRPDTGRSQNVVDAAVAEAQTEEREGTFGALTQMARERLAAQSQTFYDQANSLNDAGVNYGASLATSIALGFQVDEFGNPLLDETNNPIPLDTISIWNEIRGLKFDMGTLVPPGQPARMPSGRPVQSTRDMSIRAIEGSEPERLGRKGKAIQSAAKRDARSSQRQPIGGRVSAGRRSHLMTPAQALGMLNSMEQNDLIRLQQEMLEAGLYGEDMPSWGVADTRTRQAFLDMFQFAAQNTDEPIDVMLNRLADERINRQEALGTEGGAGGGGGGALQLPDFKPEVTSRETLSQQIDEIARAVRGEFASPEEKEALITQLQARELEVQRQNYDRDVASIRGQAGQAQQLTDEGPGAEQIDAFMAAISGQESGGNYGARNQGSGAYGKFQIMPANWPSWAQRAGLPRNAPQTPQNQELVARRIMLDYFAQFGNWRDVAVAWYAGPGNVGLRNSTRPQRGGPSIKDYADQVLGRMGQVSASGGGQYTGATTGGMSFDPIEVFDPAAEAEAILKAQDPAGWQAHEFGQRAIDFYQLLGGVVNLGS